jgi:hypothetical protein
MTIAASASQPPPYPRRFSWPMRIFLTLFLAGVTYRCFAILLPIDDWNKQYEVRDYPERLSTLTELAEKSNKATEDNPHPVVADVMSTADSVWDYWKPWPGARTRAKINSWEDGTHVAACWFDGHLAFVEHLCGINEGWPMFSPYLAQVNYHTRARLIYEDDSDLVIRQTIEPVDYRHYSHGFQERITNYETRAADNDEDACYGYCNLLRHRYERNAAGSKLVIIVLFQVTIYYPPPGADPQAHYAEQNRLTVSPPRRPHSFRSVPSAAQVLPDFYVFDVAQRKGQLLPEENWWARLFAIVE